MGFLAVKVIDLVTDAPIVVNDPAEKVVNVFMSVLAWVSPLQLCVTLLTPFCVL
jgi:hypothetical protein